MDYESFIQIQYEATPQARLEFGRQSLTNELGPVTVKKIMADSFWLQQKYQFLCYNVVIAEIPVISFELGKQADADQIWNVLSSAVLKYKLNRVLNGL